MILHCTLYYHKAFYIKPTLTYVILFCIFLYCTILCFLPYYATPCYKQNSTCDAIYVNVYYAVLPHIMIYHIFAIRVLSYAIPYLPSCSTAMVYDYKYDTIM